MKTKHIIILGFFILFSLQCNCQQVVEGIRMDDSVQYNIKIILGETILTATLYDNPTTRDFISLLPLELKLDDYSRTEKINYLPKKLSTEGSPSGFDPSIGDITYYAPWGNLAIFYKDFGYANGLINLGRINSGIEALNKPNSLTARIELIK